MSGVRPGRPKELKVARAVGIVIENETKEVLESIAQREKKSVSELLRPVIDKYAHDHASSNDQARLDLSIESSEFMAMPTMGEILRPARLDGMSDADLEELAKAAKGRSQEIQAALERRQPFKTRAYPAIRWPDE